MQAVIGKREETCPQCGHKFTAQTSIRHRDEELVKLGSGEQGRMVATVEERRTFYRECLGYCRQKGLKPGVAYYAHIERYRMKSDWEWNKLAPLTPTLATLNELKRQYRQKMAIEGSMARRSAR